MAEMEILRFRGTLSKPPSKVPASGLVLPVPPAIAAKLDTMKSAEGAINGHPFRATIDRETTGCVIRVSASMLRGASARDGDRVDVAVLGREPKLRLPADLAAAMKASDAASALWADLTELARRDYVRWVEATANPQTRARRVTRTVEQLAEGKRRPCCVNTYEYSMSRIDPDWMKKFSKTSR